MYRNIGVVKSPTRRQDTFTFGVLTYKKRKRLPDSAFAIPEKRKYPIHDIAHARNALARVAAFGTPEDKRRVKAAVYRMYPQLNTKNKKKQK